MDKRSRKIHNDRTQRAMVRDDASRADRDRRAWLLSLTPEHRAMHERGPFCSICLNNSSRQAADGFRRAMSQVAAGMR